MTSALLTGDAGRTWNGAATVWDAIRRAAAEWPDAAALSDGRTELSYAAVVAEAEATAAALVRRGVVPGDVVAICAARSPAQVLALLGVLAAGAAVAPFEVRLAPETVRENVARLRPALVLADADGLAVVPDAVPLTALQAGPEAARPAGPASDDLAYVLHTSGSSGRPKAVSVPHSAVARRFAWGQTRYPIGPGDVVVYWGSLVFDCTIWVVLAPLCHGAVLLVVPDGAGAEPRALAESMSRHRATVMHAVPSLLREFVEQTGGAGMAGLRYMLIAGERLPGELVRKVFDAAPRARVFNQYGPTEACIDVLTCELGPADAAAASVPIGEPMTGVRAFVTGTDGRPVPDGEPGELLIGGDCLAWGYLGAAAATAAAFVPDALSGAPGGRLYRTGDRVRRRPGGGTEFLGRVDHQVKIRGVRIEPSDVEHALLRHPAVAQAAVVTVPDGARGARLAAHLVPRGAEVPEHDLRAFLADRLMPAALPSSYHWAAEMPRLSSGKIDRLELARRATEDPGDGPAPRAPYEPPQTGTERRIAAIWAGVLDVDPIGRADDFVALGGGSLSAMRMIARVRDAFGVRVSVRALYRAPDLRAFAAEVDGLAAAPGAQR